MNILPSDIEYLCWELAHFDLHCFAMHKNPYDSVSNDPKPNY